MMRGVVCVALCLALLQTSSAFDWQPCAESASKYAEIKDVTLKPSSPAPGDTVDFRIEGTADIEVSEGTLDIAVAYSGLPIYSETRDLCDMAQCPIQKGAMTIGYQQWLPPITPPGSYIVTLTAASSSGEQLLCIDVDFDVTPPSVGQGLEAAKQTAAKFLHRRQARTVA